VEGWLWWYWDENDSARGSHHRPARAPSQWEKAGLSSMDDEYRSLHPEPLRACQMAGRDRQAGRDPD